MQATAPLYVALIEFRRASFFTRIELLLKKAKCVDRIRSVGEGGGGGCLNLLRK